MQARKKYSIDNDGSKIFKEKTKSNFDWYSNIYELIIFMNLISLYANFRLLLKEINNNI